jgi:hypothetical protein
MNFIRSVMEHHRNGGSSEEIEQSNHQVERNEREANATHAMARQPPQGATAHSQKPAALSGTSETDSKGGLTSEQRANIEANRAAALKRRQEHLQQHMS